MRIKWYNYASFRITSAAGVNVIIDPYQHNYLPDDPPPDIPLDRPGITEHADVVAMSHGHFDHSYLYTIGGVPQLYTGGEPADIKGIKFRGVTAYHGDHRGLDNIICMEVDGLRLCHLGDLGHRLFKKQAAEIGRVDILMTPWDNNTITMPFEVLEDVLGQLKPKVIIPMHHTLVNEFMTGRKGFVRLNTSEVEFTAGTLPPETQVMLFTPSLT